MKTKHTFASHLHHASWLAIAVTCGCQAIGGIHKAEYDPDLDGTTLSGDGDTTDSGDGDTDTNTPTSGDGDGDTTTDTPGDGDGDGDGEPVPVPGVAGAHFSADSCSTDVEISADDLVSCLYRVSCDPGFTPTFGLSQCVTYDFLHAVAGEACSIGVDSCSEVYECLHRAPATAAQLALCEGSSWTSGEVCPGRCTGACEGYCDNGIPYESYNYCDGHCDAGCIGICDSADPKYWACDGGSAVACDGGPVYDCAAFDAGCAEASIYTNAVEGGCISSPPSAAAQDCVGVTDQLGRCEGDFIYWCSNDQAWGVECLHTCVETESGAHCTLTTETCERSSVSSCDDDVLDFCDSGGIHYVHNCGRNGLKCIEATEEIDNDDSYCIADGCDGSSCAERCVDDKVVEFCVGGATVQVDCTEYGFTDCVEDTYNSFSFARCSLDGATAPSP